MARTRLIIVEPLGEVWSKKCRRTIVRAKRRAARPSDGAARRRERPWATRSLFIRQSVARSSVFSDAWPGVGVGAAAAGGVRRRGRDREHDDGRDGDDEALRDSELHACAIGRSRADA